MKVLIFGAGNLLLSDEGFGVHFIRHMEENYLLPENVELYDGGTLGIMVTHKFEEADKVFLVDVVDTQGEPGEVFRYSKDDIMLSRIPVKMSPHQIGIQEMLLISEMRGAAPEDLTFYGVIPGTLDPGSELSPQVFQRLEGIAALIVQELEQIGITITKKAA